VGCGGATVGCGGPPYAETDVVGALDSEGGADEEEAGALPSGCGGGGPPYTSTCAPPHAAVAIAKSAAREARVIGDTPVSTLAAPQNGHTSPERT
jgi:hypothetical protein